MASGGGQGGGRPGEKWVGGVRQAGEEGAGSGIPKVAESRRIREKLRNIAQYFAIEKNAKRRERTNTGWEPGLKGMGSGRFKPPVPPPRRIAYILERLLRIKISSIQSAKNGGRYVVDYYCVICGRGSVY